MQTNRSDLAAPASQATGKPSLFQRAAKVFEGWTDPDTKLGVLRVRPKNIPWQPGLLHTLYHQQECFLDGGEKMLLRVSRRRPHEPHTYLVDLTTGEATCPFPPDCGVIEISDGTYVALLAHGEKGRGVVHMLWDLRQQKTLLALPPDDGWWRGAFQRLCDGRRAIVAQYKGKPYDEPVHTQFLLLDPDAPTRMILDAEGYSCNHIQSCPTDVNLIAYDRWPCPKRRAEQVIHLMTLDGSFHEMLKMTDKTMRPGSIWGGQRDHYNWTPDGRRIVSYFSPNDVDTTHRFNHFEFGWWFSATDWRTGEDLAAEYPPGRWGGHMQITPDSRFAVSATGPGYDFLYAIDIEGIRKGWNERILCRYPQTLSQGTNKDPFHMPWVLPDASGVVFAAGWPGDQDGVYLVEWPNDM